MSFSRFYARDPIIPQFDPRIAERALNDWQLNTKSNFCLEVSSSKADRAAWKILEAATAHSFLDVYGGQVILDYLYGNIKLEKSPRTLPSILAGPYQEDIHPPRPPPRPTKQLTDRGALTQASEKSFVAWDTAMDAYELQLQIWNNLPKKKDQPIIDPKATIFVDPLLPDSIFVKRAGIKWAKAIFKILGPRLMSQQELRRFLDPENARDLTGPALYQVLKDIHAGKGDGAKLDLAADWDRLTCTTDTLDMFLSSIKSLIIDSRAQGMARDDETINATIDRLVTRDACKVGWKLIDRILTECAATNVSRPSGEAMHG